MFVCWRRKLGALLLFSVLLGPGVARAGFVEDAAFGLGFMGFDIRGQQNPLSGGIDMIVNRNFIGNPLDFGVADLSFQGPLSLQLSTSNRGVGQIDLSFTTAMNRDSQVSALNYVFNTDVGGQAAQVTGALVIDSDLSINRFGFYDLTMTLSSRQDITQSGRFANDDQQSDLDIGPVNLSGNIFADILALMTDSFFEQGGFSNTFARFSGSNSLAAMLTDSSEAARLKFAPGSDTLSVDRAKLFSSSSAGLLVDSYAPAGFPNGTVAMIVPEPTVLLLLALGVPAVIGRRRHRGS